MYRRVEPFDKVADPVAATTAPSPIVDCAANPHDLRPAVGAIMGTEKVLLRSLPHDKNLVLLLGEFHEFQAHKVLQKAILAAHVRQRNQYPELGFAVGYEGAHNFIKDVADVEASDPDGAIAMEIFDNRKVDVHEYAGSRDVFEYCRRENISVSFNDVAVETNEYSAALLDRKDAFTADLIKRYKPELSSKKIYRGSLPWAGPDINGMALSNLSMVEKSIAHIERTQARIYIHLCGAQHIMGEKEERVPFADSLSAQFEKRGFTVLPILPTFEWLEHTIPDEAASMLEKSIRISNIDRARAPRSDYETLLNNMTAQSRLEF